MPNKRTSGCQTSGSWDFAELEAERLLDQVEHPAEHRVEREVVGHLEGIDAVVGATLLGVVETPIPGLDLAVACVGLEQLTQGRQFDLALLGERWHEVFIERRHPFRILGHPVLEPMMGPAGTPNSSAI